MEWSIRAWFRPSKKHSASRGSRFRRLSVSRSPKPDKLSRFACRLLVKLTISLQKNRTMCPVSLFLIRFYQAIYAPQQECASIGTDRAPVESGHDSPRTARFKSEAGLDHSVIAKAVLSLALTAARRSLGCIP